jgi:hypothetical protein
LLLLLVAARGGGGKQSGGRIFTDETVGYAGSSARVSS